MRRCSSSDGRFKEFPPRLFLPIYFERRDVPIARNRTNKIPLCRSPILLLFLIGAGGGPRVLGRAAWLYNDREPIISLIPLFGESKTTMDENNKAFRDKRENAKRLP